MNLLSFSNAYTTPLVHKDELITQPLVFPPLSQDGRAGARTASPGVAHCSRTQEIYPALLFWGYMGVQRLGGPKR
ncbi:hypothetical protein DUNSADRAFT_3737 [Dunaliella salina]|uniref:Encoded protein n=1 Tax=Dunaliella salina TaxID=3046 RepID=A0ABQ7GTG4_DUNSA|nr:hypothetical protein DUNSADRAFT_3737 [Dunaliella salina]|eukprot:KAF5837904.1 hypothetical protein DUNSADRAFT_3737 [Dunaliella salina]